MFRITASLVCLLCVSCTAQAHPGHGNPVAQEGIQHYLTSPLHILPAAAVVACAIAGAIFLRKRSQDASQQPVVEKKTQR